MFSPFLLLAAAAASPTGPVPGEVRIFKDWYVACDNIWSCEAGTLSDDSSELFTAQVVRIRREGGPDARFRIVLRPQEEQAKGAATLVIDGAAPLTGEPDSEGDTWLDETRSMATARALANGKSASVKLSDESAIPISLAGSSAALRYIDAIQQRAGTSGAIVATGPKPDTALPPAAPELIARAATKLIALPDLKRYPEVIAETGCEYRMEGAEDTVEPLGQRGGRDMALVLIACDSGAYNFGSAVMIAERPMEDPNADWTFTRARFDSETGWGENADVAQVVNASFEPATGRLAEFAKGRGLGDCGTASQYVWDGEQFRLAERHVMDDCRGAWDWPRVWVTDVSVVR
ncbi:uncharacterized protein DUF1176 [Blastomonas natatoria]|uniref:Uncharacterized protein DUF1176 n=1 Tax=Blastomonas natatoria TaxID=34015 RepID=A0A2V3V7R9_9SPHN|nr:DUF1176 domain-containing protein [Blastomonas natatoria]PXW77600.1 uncharacterized protein DUF1176 [Blastomonas natatoria]